MYGPAATRTSPTGAVTEICAGGASVVVGGAVDWGDITPSRLHPEGAYQSLKARVREVTRKPVAATAGAMRYQTGGNAVDAAIATRGSRRTQRRSRSAGPGRRTLTARPSTKRPRSSASSRALA